MVARMKQDPRWEKTRLALLEGGRRVMARKGVDAATVLEIVKAAGVSQPSFYNHFASKEELAQAIAKKEGWSGWGYAVDEAIKRLARELGIT